MIIVNFMKNDESRKVILPNGELHFYNEKNELHRTNGPALFVYGMFNDTKTIIEKWYQNGCPYKENNLPTIEVFEAKYDDKEDGSYLKEGRIIFKKWINLKGQLHNETGFADIEYSMKDNSNEYKNAYYYLESQELSKEEWNVRTRKNKIKNLLKNNKN